jgi:hypothetical protein
MSSGVDSDISGGSSVVNGVVVCGVCSGVSGGNGGCDNQRAKRTPVWKLRQTTPTLTFNTTVVIDVITDVIVNITIVIFGSGVAVVIPSAAVVETVVSPAVVVGTAAATAFETVVAQAVVFNTVAAVAVASASDAATVETVVSPAVVVGIGGKRLLSTCNCRHRRH